MYFELTEEQRMIQKTVRKFMVEEIEPKVEEIDREDKFPPDVWKRMGDLGLLGIILPEDYGGSGYDYLTGVLVTEQMGRTCCALAMSYMTHIDLCADNIKRNSNEDQRRKYLPGMSTGEKIGALGLTEPNAGSDAVSIQLRAVDRGDYYILNGTKMFITNGPIADIILVYAKTEPEKKARGITAFIVEKDFPGFFVSRKLDKMGNRGSPTGELVFEDCRVPKENVLGEVNGGINVMMSGLDIERVFGAGLVLGSAEGALELALKYSKEREQFGQPICNFQLIKAKLADMYTEIEAARGLTYRAAILGNKSHRGGKGTELHKISAAAILLAGEVAMRAANHALQIHGGYGYMLEYPVNRIFRDAKLFEIGAGTNEIRRLVIADELIREGLEYV